MNKLVDKFNDGDFVVTSELTPPKGTDVSTLLSKAEVLAPVADAVNVTDSHGSKMSLSPVASAKLLKDAGVEPILQMTTRDRNRIALQSDMMGAWVLGIENLICMGGDPPHLGDHPDAKPVFDIPTEQLIKAAKNLNEGCDLMANSLKGNTSFNIGAVVNPGADDLTGEVNRLEKKVESGATYFQTQAVFDVNLFAEFMEKVKHLDIRVLAGIMPIRSAKMALYMNDNIPGIDVPEAIIERIEQADDILEESLAISSEIIQGLRHTCAGIHIMAPGWETNIPTLVERSGLAI